MTDKWFDRSITPRAPSHGSTGVDGVYRKGGEFEPFYVPRRFMPQVNEEDYPDLLAFAQAHGATYQEVMLAPQDVRPHQRIDHDKARKMDAGCLHKPILISVDPFILDGHHRWWAHEAIHMDISAFRFDLEFEAAIAFLFSFPKTFSYGDGQTHAQAF